jgi:hypothetical protein
VYWIGKLKNGPRPSKRALEPKKQQQQEEAIPLIPLIALIYPS